MRLVPCLSSTKSRLTLGARRAPNISPRTGERPFGVVNHAVFKKVGVRHAKHRVDPVERIFLRLKDRLQAESHQATIGNVADVILDFLLGKALHVAYAEGEFNETIFQVNHRFVDRVDACLKFIVP